MAALRRTLRRLLADDSGATAIEYALLAGLIAMAIIGSAIMVGETLAGIFEHTNTEISTRTATP
jgi:pilus assembly protein Flp/PilA